MINHNLPLQWVYAENQPDYYNKSFSPNDYQQQLNFLKTASNTNFNYVIVSDEGFAESGRIRLIWESFKGILGFQNRSDRKRVQAEIIKFLFYGATNNFHRNPNFGLLCNHFSINNSNDQRELAETIKSRLIQNFKIYPNALNPSFWGRLISQRIPIYEHYPPFGYTSLALSSDHFSKGNQRAAIINLVKASSVFNSMHLPLTSGIYNLFCKNQPQIDNESRATLYLNLALRHYESAEYFLSIKEFQQANQLNASLFSNELFRFWCEAALNINNLSEAVAVFKVMKDDPSCPHLKFSNKALKDTLIKNGKTWSVLNFQLWKQSDSSFFFNELYRLWIEVALKNNDISEAEKVIKFMKDDHSCIDYKLANNAIGDALIKEGNSLAGLVFSLFRGNLSLFKACQYYIKAENFKLLNKYISSQEHFKQCLAQADIEFKAGVFEKCANWLSIWILLKPDQEFFTIDGCEILKKFSNAIHKWNSEDKIKLELLTSVLNKVLKIKDKLALIPNLINENKNFRYYMGSDLFILQGDLLKRQEQPPLELLSAYKNGWHFSPHNPFGALAFNLKDEQGQAEETEKLIAIYREQALDDGSLQQAWDIKYGFKLSRKESAGRFG